MPQKFAVDGGAESEFYTPEEVTARETAAREQAQKEAEEKFKPIVDENTKTKEELAQERKFRAEQAINFKKLRDMTPEEKKELSPADIESRRIAEQNAEELQRIKEERETETKTRAQKLKENAIKHWAGEDADLKKKLEDNWEIINIKATDEDTAAQRAEMAMNMTGMRKNNPLRQAWNGDAPKKGIEDNFKETERGKAADKLIGDIKFN